MATRKVTELDEIAASNIDAGVDVLPIADVSEATSFKTTPSDIVQSALNAGVTLSGDVTIDGNGTKDVNFDDIATLTLDSTILNAAGVESVSISSTGAGSGQGQVEIRADQELRILTPAVVDQTATVGQVLKLTDPVNGVVEFGSPGGIVGTIIAPTATGSLNNWNPTGLSSASVIKLTNIETVGVSITGIQAKAEGDFLFVINASQYACELYFQSSSSLITNRIAGGLDYLSSTPATLAICPGQTAVFIYSSFGGQAQWIHIGNIGDGVWDIRRIPANTTIGASGSLNASRKFMRITSAATSLKGITALLDAVSASTPYIWNEITAWNMTGGSVTIDYESGSVSAANRIVTPSAANVTWPASTEARFVYDSTVSRWRLTHQNF